MFIFRIFLHWKSKSDQGLMDSSEAFPAVQVYITSCILFVNLLVLVFFYFHFLSWIMSKWDVKKNHTGLFRISLFFWKSMPEKLRRKFCWNFAQVKWIWRGNGSSLIHVRDLFVLEGYEQLITNWSYLHYLKL